MLSPGTGERRQTVTGRKPRPNPSLTRQTRRSTLTDSTKLEPTGIREAATGAAHRNDRPERRYGRRAHSTPPLQTPARRRIVVSLLEVPRFPELLASAVGREPQHEDPRQGDVAAAVRHRHPELDRSARLVCGDDG